MIHSLTINLVLDRGLRQDLRARGLLSNTTPIVIMLFVRSGVLLRNSTGGLNTEVGLMVQILGARMREGE